MLYMNHKRCRYMICKTVLAFLACVSQTIFADARLEKEIKISNSGLYFDGSRVGQNASNGPKYDFIFGPRITPDGDCIEAYKDFVFMTWYRGGENDRHVMLSRYNRRTGVTKTIEFPHRHTGYLNQPHLGESHNSIAVGIAPIDDSIHLLYDMHSYSPTRPSDGSFRNDYFRYSYSVKGAATVPDSQFTLERFVNSSRGNYKHNGMRSDEDYTGLTYPHFFTNSKGELMMWMREGGHNNGAYKFAKYDDNGWSKFTQFNVLDARRKGFNQNWGVYGDIKFAAGKMRIGFHTRLSNSRDEYIYNNGFHYAYSDDPEGKTSWKNFRGQNLNFPIVNPNPLKVSEPGDVVSANGRDSVRISRGADWTVTDRGDIHLVTQVSGPNQRKNVHTYKRFNASSFTTSTNFPGGDLYAYNDDVYLIGLEDGRVFVARAAGGTNNWTRLYTGPSNGKRFRHGIVHVYEGKAYFFLMEVASGSARPVYLQIIDLGIEQNEPQIPTVRFTSPANNARFTAPADLNVVAEASSRGGSADIVDVELYINDIFVRAEKREPYQWNINDDEINGLGAGEYLLRAKATDTSGLENETQIRVIVDAITNGSPPDVSFDSPNGRARFRAPANVDVVVDAFDSDRGDSIVSVDLFINNQFIRTERKAPYSWPSAKDTKLSNLAPGRYTLRAEAKDTQGNISVQNLRFRVVARR